MKKIITKPQFFFFFLACVLLISGFLNKGNSIPLAIYGTSMDLKIWSLCLLSALFFVLIAINYLSLTITQRLPKRGLTIIHIVFQVIALVPFLYFIYTANVLRTYEQIFQMNVILILGFLLFIIASIIHLINFIMSLLAKKD